MSGETDTDDNRKAIGVGVSATLAPVITPSPAPTSTPVTMPTRPLSDSVHNINTGESFSTIQAAIADSDTLNGHTITVDPGTYTEHVRVIKSLTIRSSSGNPADTIVQAPTQGNSVFAIVVDYVNISGFMVTGSEVSYVPGINIYQVDYCGISNNIISNNGRGILLYRSSNNHFTNNVLNNCETGIIIGSSSPNNEIRSNNISNSTDGIIISSNNTILRNNTISCNRYNFNVISSYYVFQDIDTSNTINGKPIQYLTDEQDIVIDSSWDVGYLGIVNCTNITVKDLTMTNNGQGVLLAYSMNTKIVNTTASNNDYGIHLIHSSNNTIINNKASNNRQVGFCLVDSPGNILSSNNASNNKHGIFLSESSINNNLTSVVSTFKCRIKSR